MIAPKLRGMVLTRSRDPNASTPYYQFGGQARSYPFDWRGRPGGVPSAMPAAETHELSGSGDLIESGLNPYTLDYPPLAHRGLGELSHNEGKAVKLAIAGGLLFIVLREAGVIKKRRGR